MPAAGWSRTYAPVSLKATKVWDIKKYLVSSHTSGSLRRSQAILGPTDCEVRGLPQRSTIASFP